MLLNDVHSQLNLTSIAKCVRPENLEQLSAFIVQAAKQGQLVSVAGGRHAMGGQQFATDGWHIDMSALNRVLGKDADRGLLYLEAGITWPAIIHAAHSLESKHPNGWGIRQKQTGVDEVSLGGSVSANAHGRGLLMPPMIDDVEELDLVTANGQVLVCNRKANSELFSLVVGGYGLFGVVYAVKLRLTPRLKLQRIVEVLDIEEAEDSTYRRIDEGCLYGDFQYAIDPRNDDFMKRGVFACYRPVDPRTPLQEETADLPKDAWLKLLKLAHTDKSEAFRLYSEHYLKTSGQLYWSDTMQLSTYVPSYVDYLEENGSDDKQSDRESLVIGEHYVPYNCMIPYVQRAREILRFYGTEVIYGTIRVIQKDQQSFLPWANENYACIIFNLRTKHKKAGVERVASTFKALIDAALIFEGSFFLTYHRYATPKQVEKAYPRIRDFFQLKCKYDPDERFQSDWYRHYKPYFGS